MDILALHKRRLACIDGIGIDGWVDAGVWDMPGRFLMYA